MRGPLPRRPLATALLALLVALGATGLMRAQSPQPLPQSQSQPPVVQTSIQQDGRTIGDPIIVTLTITYDAALTVPVPTDPADLGDLESAAPASSGVERLADGRRRIILTYETRAFRTGILAVQPPPIAYTDPDGARHTLTAPAVALSVESVLPPGADPSMITPRPLKPALAIGGAGVPALVIAAAIGGPVALLMLAWAARRLRRRPLAFAPPGPTPAEQAAAQLEAAAALAPSPDGVAEYCRRISRTVRQYLGRRYGLPAANLTTAELQGRLRGAGADPRTVTLVRSLLDECDAVAYAAARPATARAARYVELALEIVSPTPGRS